MSIQIERKICSYVTEKGSFPDPGNFLGWKQIKFSDFSVYQVKNFPATGIGVKKSILSSIPNELKWIYSKI